MQYPLEKSDSEVLDFLTLSELDILDFFSLEYLSYYTDWKFYPVQYLMYIIVLVTVNPMTISWWYPLSTLSCNKCRTSSLLYKAPDVDCTYLWFTRPCSKIICAQLVCPKFMNIAFNLGCTSGYKMLLHPTLELY